MASAHSAKTQANAIVTGREFQCCSGEDKAQAVRRSPRSWCGFGPIMPSARDNAVRIKIGGKNDGRCRIGEDRGQREYPR
jgi:hypothetical protein